MTFKHITFAMDLSLSSPGFAILAATDEGLPIILEVSRIKTNANKSHGHRLGVIGEEIDRYIRTYDPEHLVREKGFSRHARTTQALYKVVGVSDLYSYMRSDKEIAEIAPTSVKKAITGSGRAEKTDVALEVLQQLQIENTDEFYSVNKKGERKLIDDITDACAVGLTYMYENKLVTNHGRV